MNNTPEQKAYNARIDEMLVQYNGRTIPADKWGAAAFAALSGLCQVDEVTMSEQTRANVETLIALTPLEILIGSISLQGEFQAFKQKMEDQK